ncbi:MAG: hypothetical protein ACRDFW_05595 [bacterium]
MGEMEAKVGHKVFEDSPILGLEVGAEARPEEAKREPVRKEPESRPRSKLKKPLPSRKSTRLFVFKMKKGDHR